MPGELPPGVSPEEYDHAQEAVFRESRRMAAAAAARAVGLAVEVGGSGVQVRDVVRGAPAAGVLRPGDVIVEVDGRVVEDVSALQEAVRARPAGSEFRMTVEREGNRMIVEVSSKRLPRLTGGVGVGVVAETRDLQVDLPFEVRFRQRDVGGPSAGLAYALAIADLLDPADRAGARTIAATGTIELDGDVGPVGAVREKAVVAGQADADVFLVPAVELDAARRGRCRCAGCRTWRRLSARWPPEAVVGGRRAPSSRATRQQQFARTLVKEMKALPNGAHRPPKWRAGSGSTAPMSYRLLFAGELDGGPARTVSSTDEGETNADEVARLRAEVAARRAERQSRSEAR